MAVEAMFGGSGSGALDRATRLELAAAGGAIVAGGPVAVLLGRTSLAESEGLVVDAALALNDRMPDASFLSLLRRGNVHGAIDMGLAPGLLPGRATLDEGRNRFDGIWPHVPAHRGHGTNAILEVAAAGGIDVLVLLGADILADVPDRSLARRALDGVRTVVAVDLFATPTAARADIVLPVKYQRLQQL